MTGALATPLPRRLSNFRSMRLFQYPDSRFRDFERPGEKTRHRSNCRVTTPFRSRAHFIDHHRCPVTTLLRSRAHYIDHHRCPVTTLLRSRAHYIDHHRCPVTTPPRSGAHFIDHHRCPVTISFTTFPSLFTFEEKLVLPWLRFDEVIPINFAQGMKALSWFLQIFVAIFVYQIKL